MFVSSLTTVTASWHRVRSNISQCKVYEWWANLARVIPLQSYRRYSWTNQNDSPMRSLMVGIPGSDLVAAKTPHRTSKQNSHPALSSWYYITSNTDMTMGYSAIASTKHVHHNRLINELRIYMTLLWSRSIWLQMCNRANTCNNMISVVVQTHPCSDWCRWGHSPRKHVFCGWHVHPDSYVIVRCKSNDNL